MLNAQDLLWKCSLSTGSPRRDYLFNRGGNADGEESEVVPTVRFEAQVRPILPGPSLGEFHVGIKIEPQPMDALDWKVAERLA